MEATAEVVESTAVVGGETKVAEKAAIGRRRTIRRRAR